MRWRRLLLPLTYRRRLSFTALSAVGSRLRVVLTAKRSRPRGGVVSTSFCNFFYRDLASLEWITRNTRRLVSTRALKCLRARPALHRSLRTVQAVGHATTPGDNCHYDWTCHGALLPESIFIRCWYIAAFAMSDLHRLGAGLLTQRANSTSTRELASRFDVTAVGYLFSTSLFFFLHALTKDVRPCAFSSFAFFKLSSTTPFVAFSGSAISDAHSQSGVLMQSE